MERGGRWSHPPLNLHRYGRKDPNLTSANPARIFK